MVTSMPKAREKTFLSAQHTVKSETEGLKDGLDFSEQIARARFDELNPDLFKKTHHPVRKVLGDDDLSKVK